MRALCITLGTLSCVLFALGCDDGGGGGGDPGGDPGTGGTDGTADARGCAYALRTITTCTDTGTDVGDWRAACNAGAERCASSDFKDGQTCYDACCTRTTFRDVRWVDRCPDESEDPPDDDEDPPDDDDPPECDEGETRCVLDEHEPAIGAYWTIDRCDARGTWRNQACALDCGSEARGNYENTTGCGYDGEFGGDACACTMCDQRYRCSPDERVINENLSARRYLIEECDDQTGEWHTVDDCSERIASFDFRCGCSEETGIGGLFMRPVRVACTFGGDECAGPVYADSP